MSATRSASTKVPAIKIGLDGAALVVCGYGNGHAGANGRWQALGRAAGFSETVHATLFGQPRIEEVVASLDGAPIVVVPLLMARGVTHRVLSDRLSALPHADRVVLCPELGSHPGLARRVAAHAGEELRRLDWRHEETGLLLVGHGSPRNAASQTSTARLAKEIEDLALFAETSAAFLEERPTVQDARRACSARQVLAIGCFAEAGRHATRDVPKCLTQSGRPTAYSGPIGACDWIDSLVLDQALAGLRGTEASQ